MRSFKVLLLLLIAGSAPAAAQLSQTGAGSVAGGGTPSVCAGAIDLSVGCALPMLGGAP